MCKYWLNDLTDNEASRIYAYMESENIIDEKDYDEICFILGRQIQYEEL